MIAALSQAEPVLAAVETAINVRERRKGLKEPSSPSLDTQVITLNKSQGQSVTIQPSPTPNLQATKTALEIKSDELTIQKQQTDNALAFWTDVVAPVGTAVGVGRCHLDSCVKECRKQAGMAEGYA